MLDDLRRAGGNTRPRGWNGEMFHIMRKAISKIKNVEKGGTNLKLLEIKLNLKCTLRNDCKFF